MDKKEFPITPFNDIANGWHIPDPRSIIQVALSDYRDSDLSDKELAKHICSSLMLLMLDHNLCIDVYDGEHPYGLLFKQK